MNRDRDYTAYLYLLPAAVILMTFQLFPVIYAFLLSVHKGTLKNPMKVFIGLENYKELLTDSGFREGIVNTVFFALGSVPIGIFLALIIALLLNQKIKGLGIYRTVYYLPVITSIAAVALVWKWLFDVKFGLFNKVLVMMGMQPSRWLQESKGIFTIFYDGIYGGQNVSFLVFLGVLFLLVIPFVMYWKTKEFPLKYFIIIFIAKHFFEGYLWAVGESLNGNFTTYVQGPSLSLICITIMSVWKSLGYNIVIFLAGLQNIPPHLYEAADIDGATTVEKFWNITWPLLSPTTFFIFIMSTITSFQVFVQVFMMTPFGGPERSTVVAVYYLYEKAFKTFEFGYASALAYVVFIIVFILTLIQRKLVGQRVHYGN